MESKIYKYGITLRFVEEKDAEFIVKLRTDQKKGRFLSKTSPSIADQIQWIKDYKAREAAGIEFYFIVEKDSVPYGTVRIYNVTDKSFETGSWLFKEGTPTEIPFLAEILSRELAFKEFPNIKYTSFEVRKANKKVLRYHKTFYDLELVGEDDLNEYFHLSKEKWEEGKNKILEFLGL